jgi:hypothetical protein
MVRWRGFPEYREWTAEKVEKSMKEFLGQMRQGMTVTRLPRPLTAYIRDRITLVVPVLAEDQTAYWKDRLGALNGTSSGTRRH